MQNAKLLDLFSIRKVMIIYTEILLIQCHLWHILPLAISIPIEKSLHCTYIVHDTINATVPQLIRHLNCVILV